MVKSVLKIEIRYNFEKILKSMKYRDLFFCVEKIIRELLFNYYIYKIIIVVSFVFNI